MVATLFLCLAAFAAPAERDYAYEVRMVTIDLGVGDASIAVNIDSEDEVVSDAVRYELLSYQSYFPNFRSWLAQVRISTAKALAIVHAAREALGYEPMRLQAADYRVDCCSRLRVDRGPASWRGHGGFPAAHNHLVPHLVPHICVVG